MLSLKDWSHRLFAVFLGNTAVAGLLTLLSGEGFARYFVASQCIGFSCMLVVAIAGYFIPGSVPRKTTLPISLLAVGIGLPLGALLSYHLGVPLGGRTLGTAVASSWRYVLLAAAVSFAYHFYYSNKARLTALETARREAELREAVVQKTALHARLAMLQAQIEPHFLFNTLANLHSLIGRDDAAARSLLEKLNDYLRATLVHSRAERATLGDEFSMLSAYLAIQAQRMGDRLRWHIDAAGPLRAQPFPPMLLQPLVENAIVHGMERKLGDGLVSIRASEQDGMLKLSVSDDGPGFGSTAGNGIGLANVRERLAALFGDAGRLEIMEQASGGVCAELWIPLDVPAP